MNIEIIENLKKSDDKSDEMKLNEVIVKWIEAKPTPTTWINIIEVVKGENSDVAYTIMKYLNQILSEQEQAKLQGM